MQKTWKTTPLLLVVLFCGAKQMPAQEAGSAQQEALIKLQNKIDEMQAKMAEMQSELDAMSGAKVPETGAIESTPLSLPKLSPEKQDEAVGKATENHQTFSQDEEDAPRLYNAPLEPDLPGFFLLPGTHTMLRLDGSIRTDLAYDPRGSGLGDSFVPSSIPIPFVTSPGNFLTSIRGSRFSSDFRIPAGEWGTARTFIQLDFFGPNGTTVPRLRHFYAQLDNILVGQTFTNFMDPDAFPDSLDTQGVNSAISVRVPQVRYSFGLGGGTSGYVSLEMPSSNIDFSIAGTKAIPITPAPDFTFRLRNEGERGHIQLASVFRYLSAQLPDGGPQESAFGWGLNGTGGLTLFGRDNIVLGVAYGDGISRYVGDAGGLGLDLAPRATTDLSLRALPLFSTYGSYQHYFTPALRANATFGFVQVQNTAFQPEDTYHKSTYSSASLIWNPLGSLDLGAEFLYGWVEQKSGEHSSSPRFQLTARYTFVKLKKEEESQ